MVWYRALKFVTHLEYEYVQVAVYLFCENVTLVHCSVVVSNYILALFLCLEECVAISKFGSTVLCGSTRKTRVAKYKPIAWHTGLLDYIKWSTLDSNPFIQWSLSDDNEVLHGRIVVCLSQEQLGYSTKYIFHWNWDIKT